MGYYKESYKIIKFWMKNGNICLESKNLKK